MRNLDTPSKPGRPLWEKILGVLTGLLLVLLVFIRPQPDGWGAMDVVLLTGGSLVAVVWAAAVVLHFRRDREKQQPPTER